MLRWEQWGLPRAARREGVDVVLTLSERAALWGTPRVVYVFEHPTVYAVGTDDDALNKFHHAMLLYGVAAQDEGHTIWRPERILRFGTPDPLWRWPDWYASWTPRT